MATEIILIRHAQARANKNDFIAFDNKTSPLTKKGIRQCRELRTRIRGELDIDPLHYDDQVAVSEFTRPQQTAIETGFRNIIITPLLNEPDFSRGTMTGAEIVEKHQQERWAPNEARSQAQELIEGIVSGGFPYFLSFTHGMFTAAVLLELEAGGQDMSEYQFDPVRGYVPMQAGITKIKL